MYDNNNFYQCGKCRAIYLTYHSAKECCQPRVITLNHEDVQSCINHDPLANICLLCKGTGLVLKDRLVRV